MTIQAFKESTASPEPPHHLSNILQGLWYDRKGDWDRAHDLVDGAPGDEAAWVHAYLHRKEGDNWNADYWYRRAGRTRPDTSLEDEWLDITKHLLNQK